MHYAEVPSSSPPCSPPRKRRAPFREARVMVRVDPEYESDPQRSTSPTQQSTSEANDASDALNASLSSQASSLDNADITLDNIECIDSDTDLDEDDTQAFVRQILTESMVESLPLPPAHKREVLDIYNGEDN